MSATITEPTVTIAQVRAETVGLDVEAPLLNGGRRRYVNLDNASSTPTFRPVLDKINEFMRFYTNVSRGTGFKSQLATWAFEEARRTVARFIKADPSSDTIIFTRNTTESLNRLARLFPFRPDGVVLVSQMEHHSNDLPWREVSRVIHTRTLADGTLDMNDYAQKLRDNSGRVDLVAVTGASNVTGFVNPVHQMARLAHEAGARIVIDAAQIAPHRPIDMRPAGDPEHLDFLAFSGHKTYAPYGIGVLAGCRDLLYATKPALVGGGVVDMVTLDCVMWRGLPEREEAGTPAVVGAVGLAAAINLLESVGWDAIRRHEEELTLHALRRLAEIPGVKVFGKPGSVDLSDQLGLVAFNVKGRNDFFVSAVLSYEAGIGVRCGWFCAHPYVFSLLGLSPAEIQGLWDRIGAGNKADLPGIVRASFGLCNDESDADALCDCVASIAAGKHGRYEMNPKSGEYSPVGFPRFRFEDYFQLAPRLSR